MRIELKGKAEDNALKASGSTGRSVNDLTNLLWESLELEEITQIVSLQFKSPYAEGSTAPRKVIKKIRKMIVRL